MIITRYRATLLLFAIPLLGCGSESLSDVDDFTEDEGEVGETTSELQIGLANPITIAACGRGYRPIRGKCVDIDECVDGGAMCGSTQKCVNTVGSYTCKCADPKMVRMGTSCICPTGYEVGPWTVNGVVEYWCLDVDECEDGTANCGTNMTCANTYGSYYCECVDARMVQSGNSCEWPDDYCDEGRFRILDPGQSGCQRVDGSGLVRDNETGLTWMRNLYWPNENMTRYKANAYCSAKGMRLPTLNELYTIAGDNYSECAFPCHTGLYAAGYVHDGFTVAMANMVYMGDVSLVMCVE